MSLIFDGFPSTSNAVAFVAKVKERFGLHGQVFATDDEAYTDDPRPWACDPPIVHIDRVKDDGQPLEELVALEEQVEASVDDFGGVFCGT